MKKPTRIVQNILSDIKLKCEQCQGIVSYDKFNSHKESCMHNEIICPYCEKSFLEHTIKMHNDGCLEYNRTKYLELKIKYSALKIKCSKLETNMKKNGIANRTYTEPTWTKGWTKGLYTENIFKINE